MRDPYSVLGVEKASDKKQIKSAFRKLAKKFHPDQNKDNPKAKDKFAEINSAYEILGDKEKKSQFDRGEIDAEGKPRFTGFEGMQGGGRRPHGFGGQQGFGSQQDFQGAEDILSQIFGGRGGNQFGNGGFTQGRPQGSPRGGPGGGPGMRQQRTQKGADIKAFTRVTLEELALGKASVRLGPNRTVAVSIPAGAEDGQVIRLKGQGEESPVGPPGDALVTISIRPHKHFKRQGNDLRVDIDVPLEDAVLGAKVRVPTLTGAISLKIPAWSNSGKVFKVPGKGLPGSNGKNGDILASLRIVLPDKKDPTLIELMKKWQSGREKT